MKNRNFGGLVVALVALVFFALLAHAVMQGHAIAFDAAVRNAVHAASFPALTYVMQGISDLGESAFLVVLGLIIGWRLMSQGRRPQVVFLATAALGAEVIDQALKFWFQRPRPEVFFGLQPLNYSFPSGHAMVSYCFYLAVAEILSDEQWSRSRRLAVWALAMLITGLIGLSRIYLGVHYPTDVLGGYAVAIAWLAIVRVSHVVWQGKL